MDFGINEETVNEEEVMNDPKSGERTPSGGEQGRQSGGGQGGQGGGQSGRQGGGSGGQGATPKGQRMPESDRQRDSEDVGE